MGIEGKVAAILNERDLVINKGSEAGVEAGMKFKVIEPSLRITDPDTGESLGTLTREKIRVQIVEVSLKYSIGKTYETFMAYVERPVTIPFIPPPRVPVTRVRTLKYEGGPSDTPFLDYLSADFVKVGDPVVQIEGEP
jgi:hypothetical protein